MASNFLIKLLLGFNRKLVSFLLCTPFFLCTPA